MPTVSPKFQLSQNSLWRVIKASTKSELVSLLSCFEIMAAWYIHSYWGNPRNTLDPLWECMYFTSVAGRTLPYLSKFSSSSFFRFGGRPRLLPVFPGTFGVFVCPPHPLKNGKTTMKYLPARQPRLAGREKGTEIGTAARIPTKGGIKSEQQQDGEGRGGIPTGWAPGLGAGGAGQPGRNAVGQAASLPQQALPVPQRLQAAWTQCMAAWQPPACLATRVPPALPLPRPRSPRHNSSQAEEPPPAQAAPPSPLHPDTGGGV